MAQSPNGIGFIGTGLLGLPIAQNLLDAGYPLSVYNRTAAKASSLLAGGANLVSSPANTLTAGGVVVSVLWDGDAVEDVVHSEGFLDRLGPGGVHVSVCTSSPESARRLAQLHAAHGSIYVEAPVFGRPEAAAQKKLWMPIAGPAVAKARVRPVLAAMGTQGIFDFGEQPGAAVTVKLVGNFLLISASRSMQESFATAEKTGVDVAALVSMLTQTLFPSPIYESYGRRIADKSPALTSPIPAKDLALLQAMGREHGTAQPIVQALLDSL